jgi:hypothetical protein
MGSSSAYANRHEQVIAKQSDEHLRVSRSTAGKFALVTLLAAAVAAFFLLDLGAYLTLDSLKAQQVGSPRCSPISRCW